MRAHAGRRAARAGGPARPSPSRSAGNALLALQAIGGNAAALHTLAVQRDGDEADATARPASSTIDAAYSAVDYGHSAEDFLAGTDRRIRETFAKNGWVNTCAARLTHALNEAGHGIPSGGYYDSQKRRWMASARATRRILRTMWGAPDHTPTSEPQLDAVIDGLASGQVAVFAGQGHVGMLKAGYADPYVRAYLPVDVWVMAP